LLFFPVFVGSVSWPVGLRGLREFCFRRFSGLAVFGGFGLWFSSGRVLPWLPGFLGPVAPRFAGFSGVVLLSHGRVRTAYLIKFQKGTPCVLYMATWLDLTALPMNPGK
jgi:hypothetical protein